MNGQVARFLLTGGIGFFADAGALAFLLAETPLDPFAARVVSIGFALCVTWLINRNFTFRPSSRGVVREGAITVVSAVRCVGSGRVGVSDTTTGVQADRAAAAVADRRARRARLRIMFTLD